MQPWCARNSPSSRSRSRRRRATRKRPRRSPRATSASPSRNMANAIKFISVQRGHDVTEYTLACFGGAGGQHACLVADELGMKRVYIHPLAGVLSAYGMGLAPGAGAARGSGGAPPRGWRAHRHRGEVRDAGRAVRARARRAGRRPFERLDKRVHLKYDGTDTSLSVPLASIAQMRASSSASIAIASVSSCPTARSSPRPCRSRPSDASDAGPGLLPTSAVSALEAEGARDRRHDHAAASATTRRCIARDELAPGARIAGPAIIAERNATTDRRARMGSAHHGARPPRARARGRAQGALRPGHDGRPGDAGSLQQPLHVHRRADGRAPRADRVLGEHQGAPRFLVRALRRRGQPHRQRAAHAGAPGLHGREHQDRRAQEPGQDEARRRLRAERSVQRRDAPARRDGGHAGVRRCGAERDESSSTWVHAAITPTSAGSRPAPCRPSRRPSRKKACSSTT